MVSCIIRTATERVKLGETLNNFVDPWPLLSACGAFLAALQVEIGWHSHAICHLLCQIVLLILLLLLEGVHSVGKVDRLHLVLKIACFAKDATCIATVSF